MLYKERNTVERCINRLRNWRGIATRYSSPTAPERQVMIASRKHGLAGRNRTTRYTYGWMSRLAVYRVTGNVHWATAHASR